MRRAARTDASHDEIRTALRKAGCRVADTSALGCGFPDLVVYRVGQPIRLLEVKTRGGVITAAQEAFMAEGWPVSIVRTVREAFAAVKINTGGRFFLKSL